MVPMAVSANGDHSHEYDEDSKGYWGPGGLNPHQRSNDGMRTRHEAVREQKYQTSS